MPAKTTTKTPAELRAMMADYNPRRITEAARRKLRASIKTFGLVQPIVINTRTNRIIGGHQRVLIAEELGLEKLLVLEVDLDPTREKLANVALNKIKGKFNAEKLEPLFEILEASKVELEATGYDAAETQEIISLLHSGEHRQADFETVIVKLNRQDKATVTAALRKAKAMGPFTNTDNKNSNGNALERLAQAYLDTCTNQSPTTKPASPAAGETPTSGTPSAAAA